MRMRAMMLMSAFCGAVVSPIQAQAPAYRSYANARYGYAICYPAFMKSRPEAPNGDGRVFTGPGGATLTVFGRNNQDGTSLSQTVREDSADLAGDGGKITYRAQRANWAVYSGMNDKKLFYSKTFQRASSFVIFELTYPRAAAARYNAVAARISRCFRLLG